MTKVVHVLQIGTLICALEVAAVLALCFCFSSSGRIRSLLQDFHRAGADHDLPGVDLTDH